MILDYAKGLRNQSGGGKTPVTAGITKTVGTGGDYADLQTALDDIYATYESDGEILTLNILAGHVINYQTIVSGGKDLSFVKIVGEDAVTNVSLPLTTSLVVGRYDHECVFGAINESKFPIVGQSFTCVGDMTGMSQPVFMIATNNSKIQTSGTIIIKGINGINTGYGIVATSGSELFADVSLTVENWSMGIYLYEDAVLDSGGTTQFRLRDNDSYGLYLSSSTAWTRALSYYSGNGSGGIKCVNSKLQLYNAYVEDNFGSGLVIEEKSNVRMFTCTIQDNPKNFQVLDGSIVYATSCSFKETVSNANGSGEMILVTNGSYLSIKQCNITFLHTGTTLLNAGIKAIFADVNASRVSWDLRMSGQTWASSGHAMVVDAAARISARAQEGDTATMNQTLDVQTTKGLITQYGVY